MSEDRPRLAEVVRRHRKDVMKISGVNGIAGGLCQSKPDEKCIIVYVTVQDRPEGLPRELEGYPVEVVRTGRGFRPLPKRDGPS